MEQPNSFDLAQPSGNAATAREVRHTPGPWNWYWRQEDGEAHCGVNHEEHRGIATSVCRAPRYETQEQWEANARLIAAAPDLLGVAQMVLDEATDSTPPALIAYAQAAIARATGATS